MASPLPDAVAGALQSQLSVTIQQVSSLTGGMINQAAKVITADGTLFVKWRLDAPGGMFAAEARGLAALDATRVLRVPHVLAVGETVPFLATEYLEATSPPDSLRFARSLGEQLANLHQSTAAVAPPCGFDSDNFIGTYVQANLPRTTDWVTFYRERRLLPQIMRAREAGRVRDGRDALLQAVLAALDTLLRDLPPAMSLLHGDLWAGNLLCIANDTPALIDPAVYYGPREMEIAYMELFGGFPAGWRGSYDACWALTDGYPKRRPLHQLYPLLVHLNCFGEEYGPRVERACQDALAAI